MKRLLVMITVLLIFLVACDGNNEKNEHEEIKNDENKNTGIEEEDDLNAIDVIEIDVSTNDDRDYVSVEERIIDDDYMSLTLNEIKYDSDSEEYKLDFDVINKLDETLNMNGRDYYFDGDSIDDRGYFREIVDNEDAHHARMLILNYEDKYDEDLQELGDSLEFTIETSVDDDLLNHYDVKINID